jgi:hypothetical protein
MKFDNFLFPDIIYLIVEETKKYFMSFEKIKKILKKEKKELTPREEAIRELEKSRKLKTIKIKGHKEFYKEMIALIESGSFNVSNKKTFNQSPLDYFKRKLRTLNDYKIILSSREKKQDSKKVRDCDKEIEKLQRIITFMEEEIGEKE